MKYEPHCFRPIVKGFTYHACVKCGLVLLRNPATAWAVRQGCNYDEVPNLKSITKQLAKEHHAS